MEYPDPSDFQCVIVAHSFIKHRLLLENGPMMEDELERQSVAILHRILDEEGYMTMDVLRGFFYSDNYENSLNELLDKYTCSPVPFKAQ